MSLILRERADVDSFARVILATTNRVNRCRLGPVILSLAAKGKNSGEIAEILKSEGIGGDSPVSASTIARWLRATGLFRGRGKPDAENRKTSASVRGLLAAYEKEVFSGIEDAGGKFLTKVAKTLRRARKRSLGNSFQGMETKTEWNVDRKREMARSDPDSGCYDPKPG